MALDGEIMRFIGNELMNTGSKGLAKAGAKATLSSLVTNATAKAGAKAGAKAVAKSTLKNILSPVGIEKVNIVNGRLSDANGNPMRVYHSTPNEFTEFDDSKLGQNTRYENTGYGHFTTPDRQFSERFKDINNEGLNGRTMELQVKAQKPITHPYMAGLKYGGAESDQIVRNYMNAIGVGDQIADLEEAAAEDGISLYDAYMNATIGEDPYEMAQYERDDLMKNGYDAMEIVEGRRNDIVDGAKENTPVSSIVAFEGKNLRPTTHLPISAVQSKAQNIPVEQYMNIERGISAPTLEKLKQYLGDMKNPEIQPRTYNGNAFFGQGYYFSDDPSVANRYATDYAQSGEPYGAVIQAKVPKSRFTASMNKDNQNSLDYFVEKEIENGNYANAEEIGEKKWHEYLEKNNILGKRTDLKADYATNKTLQQYGYPEIHDTYVVMNNEGVKDAVIKRLFKDGSQLSGEEAEAMMQMIEANPEAAERVAGYLQAPTDANADGVINWNDVKAVYNQAKQQQAELDKMGRAIAEKEGFPEYTDFSPKSIESMENKVKRKGGDYSLASMKDHTRNKIMMNSWEDVPKVISDMEQMGLSPDVEFVLNDWGYKGLHITGRFDNGLGWEIQLTTPEDWPRKLKSDAIYDKWRNTQLDTASPKEVMGYLNAMRESKAMWSESKIPDLSMYDNVTGR